MERRMNEQIKQLAEQAGYSKDYLEIGLPSNMEKFVKLIVRECAEIAEAGWAAPGIQIKRHFGVEE
jgi:hypothetical protein